MAGYSQAMHRGSRWVRRLTARAREWAYGLPAPPVFRTTGVLVWRSYRSFSRDDGSHMAAGMAYYALFSLFPLLLGLVAIASFFVESESAQVRLFDFVEEQFPGVGDSAFLKENVEGLVKVRGVLGLASVFGLFWSGSAVFGSLHKTLNRTWGVTEPRPFLIQRVRQVAMAFAVGLVFLISVGISSFGQSVGTGQEVLGFSVSFLAPVWPLAFALLPLVLSFTIFMLIFRLVPNTTVYWRDAAPAALFTAVLFEASKAGFVWYLANFASFDRVYGSISAVVVLMLWAYVAANILVVGAEVCSEHAHMRREGVLRGGLRPVRGGLRPPTEGPPED